MKNLIIRSLCFVLARPIFADLFKTLTIALRYFQGLGSGSHMSKSGEIAVIKYAMRICNSHPICIDVGVNVGLYSTAIKLINNEAQIIGFEASKNTFQKAQLMLKEFDGIEIINKGLSDKNCNLTLFYPFENSGVASFHKHHEHSFDILEEVQCITLDSFAIDNSIKEISLLKIDVEGHELNVLKGCTELLEKKIIKVIQFDGGSALSSRQFFYDFWILLNKYKYTIYRVLPYGFIKIQLYDEVDECMWPTIYMAVSSEWIYMRIKINII